MLRKKTISYFNSVVIQLFLFSILTGNSIGYALITIPEKLTLFENKNYFNENLLTFNKNNNNFNNHYFYGKQPKLHYIDWDEDKDKEKKTTPTSPQTINNTTNEDLKTESSWLSSMWGQPFSTRVYIGMWTRHFQQRKNHIKNNKLLAICYDGIYAGTFINSHGDRTYSLGAQRLLYSDNLFMLDVELGYRIGIMYGYKRYLRLFGTSVFPLVQFIADFSYNGVIAQVSWAWMVFTIGLGYKF